jgi:hypothetical protein
LANLFLCIYGWGCGDAIAYQLGEEEMKKRLTAQQIYNREYWKENKERITLKRQTEWKEEIAEYQKGYRKAHLKAYKAYQKKYRKLYYLKTGH